MRVDPGAATDGSGQSWTDARNDLQAALSEQAARGGGEVWVLGGEFPALVLANGTALSVASNVTLRGGFAGTETAPEQRALTNPLTSISATPESTTPGALIQVQNQHDVLIERFELVGGSPAFSIQNSQHVNLIDVTSAQSLLGVNGGASIHGSSVRLERVSLGSSNDPPFDLADSDLAVVDSALDGPYYAFRAERSRLLLDRVDSASPVMSDEASTLLVVDSSFSKHADRGAVLYFNGPAAVVGSELLTGGATSSIWGPTSAQLLVFNTTFLRAQSQPQGGSYPQAAAIDANNLELSLSTFYDFWCQSPWDCHAAIAAGSVNNSLFVREAPMLSDGEPPIPPEHYVLAGTETPPPSNCASFALEGLDPSTARVLPGYFFCPNTGDAALIEQARQDLLSFAQPFEGYPFEVDLSRYAKPLWWQSETLRTDAALDVDAPDPGRHWAAP